MNPRGEAASESPMVMVRDLTVEYRTGRRELRAVDSVELSMQRGEVLCVVGESGSGKSTLAKAILRLTPTTSGAIEFDGESVTGASRARLRQLRSRMQMVFQDPYASLNARMTVGDALVEPLAIHRVGHGKERRDRALDALHEVGLPDETMDSYPHELSGGQRQRVGIARALILRPDFVVADEPVAALDVSIQAQVINLLQDLQREHDLTLLVISHDLAVVRHLADRVAVMYAGQIVERGDRDDLYQRPAHPYTQALLSAAPIPAPEIERGRDRLVLDGDPPSPYARPAGCRFSTRCPLRKQLGDPAVCTDSQPALVTVGGRDSHRAACHFVESDVDNVAAQRAAVHLIHQRRKEEAQ